MWTTPHLVTRAFTAEDGGAGGSGGDPAGGNPAGGEGGGQQTPTPVVVWDMIPETLRDKQDLARYKDPSSTPEDVFNDLIASKSMLGKMAQGEWAQLPDANDAAARRAILGRLGVNEDLATYMEEAKVDPATLPEGFEVDADFDKAFVTLAHEVGIHPKDVGKFRTFVAEQAAAARLLADKAQEEKTAGELGVLEAAWGPKNGKNYAALRAAANEAADRLNYLALGLDAEKDDLPEGAPTVAQILVEAGLATNPTINRALAALNKVFTGNSTVPIPAAGGGHASTPGELEAQADALQSESVQYLYSDTLKMERMQQEAFRLRERAATIRKGG